MTPVETLIMDALWDESPAAVKQIQERFQSVKPTVYSTVLTMMRILRNKGFLVSERQGKVDLCRQVVCRGDSGQRSLCEVTDQGQIEKGVIEDK